MTSTRPEPRLRETRQGAAVDQVLVSAEGFLTAQAVYDELRRRGEAVGLTTVYRHLKRLTDAGHLDTVVRPDGEASYRLCGPTAPDSPSPHHHHLVCRVCGYSVEIEAVEVESWAASVAAEAGFDEVTHTLEIFGVCERHRTSGHRRAAT